MSLIGLAFGGIDASQRGWTGGISLGLGTLSGERVSPEKAATLAVYLACIRNIAQDTGKLPLRLYRTKTRGSELIWDNPVARLLREPNRECNAFTIRSTLMAWAVGWGNGYAEILRNQAGQPARLILIHPSRVLAKRDKDGALYYEVSNPNGVKVPVPIERMLHVIGLSLNGVTGVSVAEWGAESIGIALAAQSFASTFFGNGTQISGILSTPKALDEAATKRMAKSWHEAYGGAKNANKVAVLEQDLKFQPITMPMKDAQFLESRRFQNEEIARWFRMPLSKLQDAIRAQGWSTLDAQNTDYVTDTLISWMESLEQELERKLLTPEERDTFYIKHEVKGLLRGDARTRTEIIDKRVKNGTMTPNEARELEDENPIEDPAADKLYMQGAMMPLDKLGEQQAPAVQNSKSLEPSEQVGELAGFFLDAAERVMTKHAKMIESHAGRKDFDSWYAEFALKQVDYTEDAFGSCFMQLGLPDTIGRSLARDFFLNHENKSASALADLMRSAAIAELSMRRLAS